MTDRVFNVVFVPTSAKEGAADRSRAPWHRAWTGAPSTKGRYDRDTPTSHWRDARQARP